MVFFFVFGLSRTGKLGKITMTLQIVCKPGHGRARDDKGPKSVNKKQCNTIKQRNVGRNHLFNQTVGVRGKMNSRETLHFTIEREREKCRSHLHTRAHKQPPRFVPPSFFPPSSLFIYIPWQCRNQSELEEERVNEERGRECV